MTGPSARPLVVVGGTAHWGTLRLAEHHVADRLRRYADVLFVDPPVSPVTIRRRPELASILDDGRLREAADGLHVLVPVVLPGKDRPGVRRVTDLQTRRLLVAALRTLGRQPTATILTLPQRYLFDRRIPGRRLYWAKDDHAAGASLYGLDQAYLLRTEQRLAEDADRLIACSESLAATWAERGVESTVIENGCDAELFARARSAPPPDDVVPGRRYAVFVGSLTERIDEQRIEAVAALGVDVLLVGERRRTSSWPALDVLLAHPRVHHVGHRGYDRLPAYLGASTVGLLPYHATAYNAGSFPLKILEYLAAGRPVVSTDLPAARWLDTPHVHITNGVDAFAETVARLTREPVPAALADACQAVARRHDWSERTDRLAGHLGLLEHPSAAEAGRLR